MGVKETNVKPRKLGRGLSSLLGQMVPVEVAATPSTTQLRNVSDDTFDESGGHPLADRGPAVGRVPVAPASTGEPADALAAEAVGVVAPARPSAPAPAPSATDRTDPAVEAVGGKRLVMVAVGDIVPSRWQPRRHFDEAALARLAESIKSAGVMQPLVVRRRQGTGHWALGIGDKPGGQEAGGKRPEVDGEPLVRSSSTGLEGSATPSALRRGMGEAQHELVAGERRWRAATLAGIARVPCVVVEISDEESAEWGLIENVQREDLRPMERAGALANLAKQFSLTQSQVAERVGLERSSVANLVRLLELDPKLQRMIDEGALSAGHGKALLAIPREAARVQWGVRAAAESWSVRKLEEAIGRAIAGVDEHADLKDAAMERGDELPDGTEEEIRRRARKRMLADLEKRLSDKLGTKVQLRTDRTGNRGKVLVHFYTVAQFDGLLEKLGVGE